jgi:pimeloyl-ACP methyl ester carboxylesterase
MIRTVAGRDGRTLAICEAGATDGPAVFVHHGTPADLSLYAPWVEDALARGLRLIAYDRPGYGGSSPHPERAVADAAADVAAIADALGLERFATWGVSGGAPHALACAALLGDRCAATASVSAPAPFDAEGLNFFRGMGEDNLIEFGAAMAGRDALEPLLRRYHEEIRSSSPGALLESLATLVSPVDHAALSDALSLYVHRSMVRGLEPGVEGWAEDDVAFTRPWGFDLGVIATPVLVFHGEHDRFVPLDHGRWLAARVPGADVRLSDRDGHISMGAFRIPDVQSWLAERL